MNNFRVTILGSGTMVPTKDRNPAGFLVEVGGIRILLDCGHGVIRRLVDCGRSIQDIDMVFVSHFHTDHFGDAFNLVHSRWVDDIYHSRKSKGLMFLGPVGIKERYKLWRKIYWLEPREKYPILFKEGKRKIKNGNIDIELFPVEHVPWFQSVAIVIKYKKKKLVYTGDIGSLNDFDHFARKIMDADLLITECSYERPTPNHLTIEQIKDLKDRARIKKVLPVHVSPLREKIVAKALGREGDFLLKKDKEQIDLIK